MNIQRTRVSVLGVLIDVITWDNILEQLHHWTLTKESRYVCICNVHSVITAASQDEKFGQVVHDADLVTSDGMPVVWLLRCMGYKNQLRINGPDLMWKYCKMSQQLNDGGVFFYGGTEETLTILKQELLAEFPLLNIVGSISPPFRQLTEEENAIIVEQINASGAGTVWVSLGCPKQELWMAEQKGKINAVMIGVGAAFDYHAGTIIRAPQWMQNSGLEWLYRLLSEPRRLWKRYLVTNTLFIIGYLKYKRFAWRHLIRWPALRLAEPSKFA